MREENVGVRNSTGDSEWYFSSKLLIDRWAKIIGPDAFLVFHHLRSMCPDRGYAGPNPLREAESIVLLGMEKNQYQRAKKTLFRVGLLIQEGTMCVLSNPEDVELPSAKGNDHE